MIDDPSDEDTAANLHLLKDRKDIPISLGSMSQGFDYLVTGEKELLEALKIPYITTSGLLQLIYCDKPDKNQ